MVQITIRCQPRVPVSSDEVEHWLRCEVDHLREGEPQGTIRLSCLTQHLPHTDIDVGWLIELELPEEGPLLETRALGLAVRDMQLLGLQPTMLTRATGYEGLGNGDQDPSTASGAWPMMGSCPS